jgi:predicted RNA binding protein YcfA (HicA-like mRNA interferase family)
MTRLPSVSGERLGRALKRAGFIQLRQNGSHVPLEKQIGQKTLRTVVPLHSTLARGTVSDILKQTALTVDELVELR